MRVLGICGSLRSASHNRRLLNAAAAALPDTAELTLLDQLDALPAYNEDIDRDPVPPTVARLRAAITSTDAILFATPEYNSSIPGFLKNAVDWASRPFPDNVLRGKPVAVVGASAGLFGAVWAQAELRKALTTAGARVLDEELPIGQAHDAFDGDGDGGLLDPDLRARLASLVEQLVALVAEARPETADSARQ
jgi:chromate reductase